MGEVFGVLGEYWVRCLVYWGSIGWMRCLVYWSIG